MIDRYVYVVFLSYCAHYLSIKFVRYVITTSVPSIFSGLVRRPKYASAREMPPARRVTSEEKKGNPEVTSGGKNLVSSCGRVPSTNDVIQRTKKSPDHYTSLRNCLPTPPLVLPFFRLTLVGSSSMRSIS